MKGIITLMISGTLFIAATYNWSKSPNPEETSCIFSFVQISDTHCVRTEKKQERPPAKAFFRIGGYKFHWKDSVNSFPILQSAIEYVNQEIKPDFLIHTGDLTERGKLSNLKKVKELLDRLNCPYYPVMGDHDLGGYSYSNFNRSDCDYVKVFGQRSYSFDYQNWHIIILSIYPDDEELNWLKNDLSENAEKPVIFATHRLVITDRFTLWLAKKYLGVELLMPRAEEVITILKNCQNVNPVRNSSKDSLSGISNGVKVVLSGHCHSNFRWDRYGISFISTAALLEVPHQFRFFQVYRDRIVITLFTAKTSKDVFNKRWISQYAGVIK